MITITEPKDKSSFPIGSTVTFRGTNGPVANVASTAVLVDQQKPVPTASAAIEREAVKDGATPDAIAATWEKDVGPFNSRGEFMVTVFHPNEKTASRTIYIV